MGPYLSLVIPAYNEAVRLPATMKRVAEFAEKYAQAMEVLIVVEKSLDGTLEIAREFASEQASFRGFRVIENRMQRGKGYAVRIGMQRARGEIIFYMDADLSVPLHEITAFLSCFDEHPTVSVLLGNRQHAAAKILRPQSWVRRSMGQVFNRILGLLAVCEFRDTQCGFKAFRKEAAEQIFARQGIDGFAFDVEVLLLAKKLGYEVRDLPVEWVNSPESKVKIVHDSLRMLCDAVTIRRRVQAVMEKRPRDDTRA